LCSFFPPSFLASFLLQQQQQRQLVCVSLLECCSEAPTTTENQNKTKQNAQFVGASERAERNAQQSHSWNGLPSPSSGD
jgi:hypothetical protein